MHILDPFRTSTLAQYLPRTMNMKEEKERGELEPVPPRWLQEVKWVLLYGSRHVRYFIVAIFVFALMSVGAMVFNFISDKEVDLSEGSFEVSGKEKPSRGSGTGFTEIDEGEARDSLSLDDNQGELVGKSGTNVGSNKVLLTTGESPDDIHSAIFDLSIYRREERFEQLYKDRWIPKPGWTMIVNDFPSKYGDEWRVRVNYVLPNGERSRNTTILITEGQGASLRPGMKIRATGKLKEVWLYIVLDNVTYKLEPDSKRFD